MKKIALLALVLAACSDPGYTPDMPAPATPPTFATDAGYAADGDPWSGDPPRVDPGAPVRAEGFEPGQLAAEHLNFVLGNHGDWLDWLGDERDRIVPAVGGDAGSDEWEYVDGPRTRAVFHAVDRAVLETDVSGAPQWAVRSTGTSGAPPLITPLASDARAWIPLRIPSGSTITAIQVQFRTSDDRTAGGSSAQFAFELWKRSFSSWSAGAGVAGSATQIGTTQYDGGGVAGLYVVSIGSLGSPVVDNEGGEYYVLVTAPSSPAGGDQVLGLRVVYEEPGPRTH